jgi:UDP-glucose 4-epimerase
MEKKYFITGGAGLIGYQIALELHRKNKKVQIYDLKEQIDKIKNIVPKNIKCTSGSILDLANLKKSMVGYNCIFHLAAMLGVQATEEDKLSCLKINIDGTKNILDSAVYNNAEHFIFSSSSEVYGEPKINPVEENSITTGKTVYGISKLAGEELCKAYNQKYGIKYTILRYFNTYGSGQKKNFVITKFIEHINNKKKIIINGNGQQKRSYMYVTDAAAATVKVSEIKKAQNITLNIGNGSEVLTLIKLAKIIMKILKKKTKIIFDKKFMKNDRRISREIFYRYCNSDKAEKILNWKPKINIEQGIKLIVKNKNSFLL